MLCLALLVCLVGAVSASDSALRGVSLSQKTFYDPAKDFTCLDGSETIPFSLVNDDYCDCADGSDEPGTSACPNGKFFCVNKGHQSMDLLSSRVNDGICDCCDGSDEYESGTRCPNTCGELGKRTREERRLKLDRQEAGYKRKLEYMSDGESKRAEEHDKLAKLKADIGMLQTELSMLEEAKATAEEPERLAKDEQDKKWEEERQAQQAVERESQAKKGFEALDTNEDNLVSIEELQQRSELDSDGNGEVSKEEAIDYLGGEESLDFDTFYAMAWEKVHERSDFATEDEPGEEDEGIKDEDNDDDEEEEEEKDEGVYDEATQALIDAANKAREELDDAKDKKRDLEREIKEAENFLGMDFGRNNEFTALYEKCYEYTDREYTYKLCLFKKSSQRNKNGGSETSLGVWGNWDGPENDRYSRMKYENGEKCWNGPSRSTIVNLQCGAEEKITAAMEPNRCEYLMNFVTSAVCQPVNHSAYHEEL